MSTTAGGGATGRPQPLPSRTGWVLEEVRRGILAGDFVAGQPLVEADLAALYGVSKTPVREALKTLAGRGLVRLGDFKGATVSRVDRAMVADVFGVRALLEPAAVAATVRAGADLTGARDLLKAAAASESPAERSDLNREFHRVLYAGCGNDLLVEILDSLRERTSLISVALWKSEPSWDAEADEHDALWRAASTGDADGAERISREHIQHFAARCNARFD